MVTRASESLASLSSSSNAPGNLGLHARSMTSLKSADDVLLANNKNSSETDQDTKEAHDSSKGEESTQKAEKLIDFSPTEPKKKLVDISPSDTEANTQTVNGVTESESCTDNEDATKKSDEAKEGTGETETGESVDGNIGTKERSSPIVTHQPESPSRR